jgi:hypothetical protein
MHRVGDFCTRFEIADIVPNFDKVMLFDAMAYFVRMQMDCHFGRTSNPIVMLLGIDTF